MRAASVVSALALAVAAVPGVAGAGVYAHVDPVSGMIVLNNMAPGGRAAPRATGATGMNPGARISGQAPAHTGARDFPRVSPRRQRQMDGERRAILHDELLAERRALAAASAGRAAGAVLARHEANIAALRREQAGVAGRPAN